MAYHRIADTCPSCGRAFPSRQSRGAHERYNHQVPDELRDARERRFKVESSRRARALRPPTKRATQQPRPALSDPDLYEQRVVKAGTGECWGWSGATFKGYGRIKRADGSRVFAHRVAYEMVHGPIPAGMVVMHSCDNPPCTNPAHLSLGTQRDNNADKMAKGRQARGERAGNARLTDAQVEEIKGRVASGESRRSVARSAGVCSSTVVRIVNGKARSC